MNAKSTKYLAILFAAVLFTLPAIGADLTNDPLPTVQSNLASNKAVLVDVREKMEWEDGHIEGAVLLPLSTLKQGADARQLAQQLPKDKIIYTHCVVGKRALAAANILEKLGYQVRALKPGYDELVKAGFPKAKN